MSYRREKPKTVHKFRKTFGFLVRDKKIINRRRTKGRKRLTAS